MAMNFQNLFAYIELATGGVAAVITIQHLVLTPEPIKGSDLVDALQPILYGLSAVFPKMDLPAELVLDIANGAADSINRYMKKIVPVPVPGGGKPLGAPVPTALGHPVPVK